MSEPTLTAAQQRAAVDRIGDNLALRSGAGCGKTFVLARRLVELLFAARGAPDALSRLVALTFTDKAALEMTQRVRTFLAGRAKAAKGDSRRMALEWLEGLSEARISTIHAFCASLLRSGAVEAGIDPAFAVGSDDLLTTQMTAEAAEQAVLEAVEQGDPDAAAMILRGSLDGIVALVGTLVSRRTAIEPTQYGDPQATLRRWQEQAADQRRRAFEALRNDGRIARQIDRLQGDPSRVGKGDKLAEFIGDKLARVRTVLANPDVATPADFSEIASKPGGKGSPKAWGGDERVQSARLQVKELADAVCEYAIYTEHAGALDEQAAGALATLTRLALRAEDLYAAAKRARGLLDFEDLLVHAERLLRTSPDLCRSLSEGIGQMLIDECQDTDAFQVRLLERLVRGGVEGGSLPEGRIFLVGDAKQSIYRFRGAQVEVFEDWCRRLGPRHQENLDESFRTHPAAAAFVNHLFAPMMGPDYASIQAHRAESPPAECVEVLLAGGVDGRPIASASQATAGQAAVVADRIERMLAGGERRVWDAEAKTWRAAKAGDIAILFARMTASLEYERALADRDVPHYVIAGSGFFQQQEVFDVLNALRAIDNPFDDVALVGVLRSSLFGLDDNALLRIALDSRPPYWGALAAGNRPAGLSESMRESLARAVAMLARLHRDKDALPIDRLVGEVLSASAYEATLLAQPQGRRMLGNVRMLLDRARSAAQDGMALADFVEGMDELILNESRYEQAAVTAEAEDVVRLMTIHKAKGLEFPVVFLPDLNAERHGDKSALLCRSDWGLVYKLKADQDDGALDNELAEDHGRAGQELPLSFRLAKRMEDAEQDREDVRKLYVAVTRAQDHLVLVGADWRNKEGLLEAKGSFLRRIDEVLDIRGALKAGRSTIAYADGRFQAALGAVTPAGGEGRGGGRSTGQRMLVSAATAGELAAHIIASAPTKAPPLPLVGPLPPACARAEVAVTALADFATCPMLYRWQHELRVPRELLPSPSQAHVPAEHRDRALSLDPLTLGTLLHRCMELLDFAHPQPARALVTAAAYQLHLEEAGDLDLEPIAGELAAMLDRLIAQPLWRTLTAAKALLRELDFRLSIPPVTLSGQIDLLVQDAAGAWRIVDYKSDHVDAAAVPEHARRYELQLLAYAIAARRHTGCLPGEAVLYFLRPGLAHRMPLDDPALAGAEQRLAQTAQRLIAARRSGQFERPKGSPCAICPYRPLCTRCGPAGS